MKRDAPLLVIGAGGMLGSHLCEAALRRGLPLLRASSRSNSDRQFDLTRDNADAWLDNLPVAPAAAIVCSAQSNIDACRQHPTESRDLNVDGTCRLFSALAKRNIPTLFYSSDMVFAGDLGNYCEEDPCHPSTEYGRQKLDAERFLLNTGGRALVVRLGKLYARDNRDTSPLSGWFRAWNAGQKTQCATDQWLMPTWAGDVAEASIDLLEQDHQGIVHLVAPEKFTRLELARHLAKNWGFDERLIEPCSIRDFKFVEPRPLNNCLNGARFNHWLPREFFRVGSLRYTKAEFQVLDGER